MVKRIKIIKRHEHLPKPTYVLAIAEVNNQTDRGAAIAGTAYLDLLLRNHLEKRMRLDPDLHDLLFENRGVLQDFSARIQVAFAFKFVGSGAYLDLCILRDIRNAFAHSADAFGFDREDIAAKCDQLWYPRHIQYEKRPRPASPREKFIRAVELLADGLIEAEIRAGRIPIPDTFIQMGPVWPPPKQRPLPRKQQV
jgi:hypothetical protein